MAWTVRPISPVAEGAESERRTFTYLVPAFSSAAVVANASGPLAEPAGAGLFLPPYHGGAQQATTDLLWSFEAEEASWVRVFHAVAVPEEIAENTFPHDYEIRFTGSSTAVLLSTGRPITVPFELWDVGVGTPDDPADDVRLIPLVHDLDGNGAFSLSPLGTGRTSTTDAVSWARPLSVRPGESGYLAWAASATPEARGPDVLRRTVFTRSGQVSSTESGEAYPEAGTVVRLVSSAGLARPVAEPEPPATLALDVRPNPIDHRATVGYRLAEPAAVRLRVVDVLGREVAVLAEGDRAEGEHRAALDAAALAAGVYVVVLDAGRQRAVRTFTVAR